MSGRSQQVTGLRECINCQSAWPEDTYRLSDGALSNVCQHCGLERLAERDRLKRPGARTETATPNQLRSPAMTRGGPTRVYRDGTLTHVVLPRHGRLPRSMRS